MAGKAPSKRRPVDSNESEAQIVYAWRFQQFKALMIEFGVDPGQASALAKDLADSRADRTTVEKALKKGCSPEIVVDIFL